MEKIIIEQSDLDNIVDGLINKEDEGRSSVNEYHIALENFTLSIDISCDIRKYQEEDTNCSWIQLDNTSSYIELYDEDGNLVPISSELNENIKLQLKSIEGEY